MTASCFYFAIRGILTLETGSIPEHTSVLSTAISLAAPTLRDLHYTKISEDTLILCTLEVPLLATSLSVERYSLDLTTVSDISTSSTQVDLLQIMDLGPRRPSDTAPISVGRSYYLCILNTLAGEDAVWVQRCPEPTTETSGNNRSIPGKDAAPGLIFDWHAPPDSCWILQRSHIRVSFLSIEK